MRATAWRRRADFRAATGVLLVLRQPPPQAAPSPGQPPATPANPAEGPEVLLALVDEGGGRASATALAGHVDLGTGIATAYAQVVAEELGWPVDAVQVLLGDTARAPNQGPTIASTSLQIHAQPLRLAAAQAAAWLRAQAARQWGLDVGQVQTHGTLLQAADGRQLPAAALLAGGHQELWLDPDTPGKPVAEYSVVGTSVPRSDMPAKLRGEAVYVHDVRLPGMLHGRVLRPPYAGLDAGPFVGTSLLAVDEASIAHLPGIVRLVVLGDFIGIVAQREEQAEAAVLALQVQWKPHTPHLQPLDDLAAAVSANPSTPRVVADIGDVDAAIGQAPRAFARSYVWPYQLHASIGPSCAVAHWHGGAGDPSATVATVWAGTQNPHALRADLARLCGLADTQVDLVRLEAAGCYGRNSADDVAADALLLARAVAAPVRVQLTREQEHLWEPKGAAQLMQVRGGLGADGSPVGCDFSTSYPSNGAPTLALLLTGTVPAVAQAFEMGDRSAVPPYAYADLRVTVNDMAPILRASWLRGVSALPNSFAHESFIDELATAAQQDPVHYRLALLPDERARALLRATADKAGWLPHTAPQQQPPADAQGHWLRGQGVAYARYVHSKFPGFGAAWSAWVADVQVHRVTGEVHVSRVVVGQDAGLLVNPLGVTQQVHGNVLQTTSRALKEQLRTDPATGTPAAREWGSYPILSFREVPVIDVLLMPRPGEPALGVGESASVPGTAAIANAIFDATGVRFRQPPFTPEVVRAGLQALPAQAPAPPAAAMPAAPVPAAADPQRRRRTPWALLAGLAAGLAGVVLGALGLRPAAIAPVQPLAGAGYSEQLLARGRQLAALGNCAGCHTADGGAANAGGKPIATPYGAVYSTNLTPDAATGIGLWSFSAFQRAMREGISRDGHQLYPAFPYTAFTRASDTDLQALYAHLMAQPAVSNPVPETRLAFPFNQRPLMALWNALHLQPGPVAQPAAVVQQPSAQWQRGAELVNGLGHCTACHTPRDALGGELQRSAYLGGALVDGWEAPPLGALARGPLPWTEAALVQYLRQGHHRRHGIAGGSMAGVVQALAVADPADVQAMAHYLASLQPGPVPDEPALAAQAQALVAQAAQQPALLPGAAQRLFDGACGACHHDGDGPPVLGLNQPLALNSTLHSAQPDNLLRSIVEGLQQPAFVQIGHMPAFGRALDDGQLVELAGWMRQRFAPQQPPWADLPAAVARVRAATGIAGPR